MGLGHRLTHPAAGLHDGAGILYRGAGGLFFLIGREHWFRISWFWTRIFSVSFAMGVVSGIVMPFQFGTNWSRFSDAASNVISPMLAYEDLMAFFLESTQSFLLIGTLMLLPVILMYTAWSYWVFRGKLQAGSGHH